ncbi:hypothetical protein Sjap_010223 [Stephania japonica]|uniref:non-specific serine/threonine protein kinase n=1 Tax=Stephania japonica TaxID=461633 RepID=A0AAP0JB11_9MAGN
MAPISSLALLTIFSSLIAITEPCQPIDSSALLAFKNKITNDPYPLFKTWTTSTDCCAIWEGVQCDSKGRVVSVSCPGVFTDDDDYSLTNTSMTGRLTPTLANLSFLGLLDLSNLKFLKGPIPQELGKLRYLNYLYLDRNQLSGSIPASIDNQINGIIPSSLGRLSSLETLDLSWNRMTGSIPDSLTDLVSLRVLDISGNMLTGKLPRSIGKLKSLMTLHLYNNNLTGEIPDSIGELTSLNTLHLSNNGFSGKIPASIGNLGLNLFDLDLSKNCLSGPLPPQQVKLIYLQSLDSSYNPLSLGSIPSWFSKLRPFKLFLAQTGIVGELPRWLASSNIGTLDLSSNGFTGRLPNWIGNMISLSFLNLSNNGFHSSIPYEVRNLTSLSYLDLHSNNFAGSIGTVFSRKTAEYPLNDYSYIDLSRNMFFGPIEEDVGNHSSVESIETLVLSHNPLGGTIPSSFGKMRLKSLELIENGLVGGIPQELGDAMELTSIVLSKNKLSGRIPEKVLSLNYLSVFNVSENELSGEIPPHKAIFPASSFMNNKALCGSPLPPCKHHDAPHHMI